MRVRPTRIVALLAALLFVLAGTAPLEALSAFAAGPTYTLAGHIYLGSSALSAGPSEVSIRVVQRGVNGFYDVTTATSDANGDYSIPNLEGGSYFLFFAYSGAGNFADVWWQDDPIVAGANPIYVYASTGPIDVTLPLGGTVSGTVTYAATGGPVSEATVIAFRSVPYEPPGSNPGSYLPVEIHATTDSSGAFSFARMLPATYQIRYYKADIGSPLYDENWGEEAWNPGGDSLTVASGATLTADHALRMTASITGSALCDLCSSSGFQYAYPGFGIQVLDPGTGQWVGGARRPISSWSTPTFGIDSLLPGTYRVVGGYVSETGPLWGYGFSSEITLVEDQHAEITMKMGIPSDENSAGTGVSVHRIDGPDRYTVAAAMSEKNFHDATTDVVYVTSGANFPDALGAGPAAVHKGGSLLLVTPTGVPTAVMAEINRLKPKHIVVVGGPGAVSDAVLARLAQVPTLDGSDDPIVRVSGINRYQTSIATARHAFDSADVVFLSTGADFPDALSAGPAAASLGGPVVVVNGLTNSVDSATAALLRDLGTTKVYIVGGPGAVSDAFLASVDSLPNIQVERLSGADRYATSLAINGFAFPDASEVYLAVGTKYPDALAGGVLAASQGLPLIVVRKNCVSNDQSWFLRGRMISTLTLLGGTGALAPSSQLFQRC